MSATPGANAAGRGHRQRHPRTPLAVRIQRLLAILQWASSHPDGVTVEELCERFHLEPDDLVKELDLASMVGADSPHYDDMPFEVYVEDGRVYVRLFSFRRPLRLTPEEGLAMVAAADVLTDDDEADTPLSRALAKLADLLGIEPGTSIDVDLDLDGGAEGRRLRQAITDGVQVSFTYWTYGRDAVAHRTVDPWATFSHGGAWYLVGHAHDAGDQRRFRLDRMEDLEVTETSIEALPPPDLDASLDPASTTPEVVLDLSPSARWVIDAHPVREIEARKDGSVRATVAVGGAPWLERLLLQLGPDATVESIDPELGSPDIAAVAARRVLARYRDGSQNAAR